MTQRPEDWDPREEESVAAIRPELDVIADRHRDLPPVEVLRAGACEALPDRTQEAIASDLARSPWARALAADFREDEPELDEIGQRRLLDRVHRGVEAEGLARPLMRPRPSWRPLLALAAAAVLVTTVVLRLWPGTPSVVPSTPTGPAPTPVAPSWVLTLDKPDVKLTASALRRRGSGRSGTFMDEIAPAMNAYRSGDYSTAARELARLQAEYADSVEVAFYLGVSRLWLGDASGALPALNAARRVADETFSADVTWYLAVAEERAGQPGAARAELAALCGGRSGYATRACEAAGKLK